MEHRKASVSKDVAVLLNRLIHERVAGIVLDMRGNLGGLLDEAIEVGGLFCGRTPIAAARAPDTALEVLSPVRSSSRKPLYTGPLVVLTDRGSASASELVAGALQDYGRAVVVGGEQTFGKGSVQTTIPLGEYFSGHSRLPVGGLAVTIGKFYRINGQSTQLVGVRPDIVLPSTLDVPREGESALTDPLSHDAIAPVKNPVMGPLNFSILEALRSRTSARLAASPHFSEILQERDQIRRERRENKLSLEEKSRREALQSAQKSYAEREAAVESVRVGGRFARLLLEDVRSKRLKMEAGDPLATRDPESVAVEKETLQVLMDLVIALHR
jgi:carboxyl-terminal processing protease